MPSRERSFRVDAIIMRHSDWGEADRLLWLFTREFGKLRVVAKGVRKVRSRKAGHVEPFMHSALLLARGRDILLLTQAETLDAFLSLREDLLRATAASYVVELLDRFTYEDIEVVRADPSRVDHIRSENASLYTLLLETLWRISSSRLDLSSEGSRISPDPGVGGGVNVESAVDSGSQRHTVDLALRYYEIRLLDLVGFRPQLFTCLGCGQDIKPEDQYFSAERGGVLCPKCGRDVLEAKPVSTNVLRYLRHFQRSEWGKVKGVSLSASLSREIEVLLQHYFTYLLERGLNTPAFMRRVRSSGAVRKDQV